MSLCKRPKAYIFLVHSIYKSKYIGEKIMKKGLTELVFILDRSGSMQGLEKDTIGGFNGLIEKQKKEEGEAYISTILFDDVQEVLHDRVNLQDVKALTEKDYSVRGSTALLDAVGRAIKHISTIHKYIREEDRPEKTIFVITTDGAENASTKYTQPQIKEMIEQKTKLCQWEFLFLGANIDAVTTAANYGIAKECAAQFQADAQGVPIVYSAIDNYIGMSRKAKGVMCRAWAKELDNDKKR